MFGNNTTKLITGNANRPLAEAIAQLLSQEAFGSDRHAFLRR